MSRERRSNEVPGLADRGYSSFVVGYCLEKPLTPLLGLKMLSQGNGLVFLLLVYAFNLSRFILRIEIYQPFSCLVWRNDRRYLNFENLNHI
jgi:hypothetical protein